MESAMMQPLLSVVIPTYNRGPSLGRLLEDLSEVMRRLPGKLEVVVCDNSSTDATADIVQEFSQAWVGAVKYVRRAVNLGIEGNIACSMIEGRGQYVWMLSDHQRLLVDPVIDVVGRLETVPFDIAYAGIAQWQTVLKRQGVALPWNQIDEMARGAMLFSLGNISALMFRRELALASMKAIFRSCCFSYPHLGLLSAIHASTRVIEFEKMSSLPEGPNNAKLSYDYDRLDARFRANFECVQLQSRNAGFTFSRAGFFTPDYRTAFRVDVLNMLRVPGLTRRRAWQKLWPLVKANPFALKLVAGIVLVGVFLLPTTVRVHMAARAREILCSQANP